jgi:hypothetical protein
MPHRVVPGAVALLVCVTAAGCVGSPVPSPFAVEYPAATAGGDPVPLSLIDQTGLVSAMTEASEVAAEGVSALPGQPNVLRVSWPGGVCDDRATLVLNTIGAGYQLAIHNHPRFTAGVECDDSVVTRAVDITFRQPLDPAALALDIVFP